MLQLSSMYCTTLKSSSFFSFFTINYFMQHYLKVPIILFQCTAKSLYIRLNFGYLFQKSSNIRCSILHVPRFVQPIIVHAILHLYSNLFHAMRYPILLIICLNYKPWTITCTPLQIWGHCTTILYTHCILKPYGSGANHNICKQQTFFLQKVQVLNLSTNWLGISHLTWDMMVKVRRRPQHVIYDNYWAYHSVCTALYCIRMEELWV